MIQAPIAFTAGGARRAGPDRRAYWDAAWIGQQFDIAAGARAGCGLITWKLAEQPQLLDQVWARIPAALFLSLGHPAPFAPAIRDAGVPLICRVQTLPDARQALECGRRRTWQGARHLCTGSRNR
ncbi:hypothetical protein [Leisingera sp.]|uniref:hypothetical protein n=1 Tax=Leisingera sp. TaxID=1879318 RepID=UPI002B26BD22|nr:hypothetical protein [Leisingera sp.]